MPTYFSNALQKVGSQYEVLYEVPKGASSAFVTGLYLANVTDKNTFCEIVLVRGETETHLTSSETPLPSGSTMTIATPAQSLHLLEEDKIKVRCTRDQSADAYITGHLEISEIIEDKDFCDEFKAAFFND